MQSSEILRTEVKFRFIDYLKAAQIPYYEPSLTVCPHCGQHAQVVGDFLWNCPNCGSKGDVVDYAMESHGFRKAADALKHVCRVLGVKICSLDTIAADELMDMQFPDNPGLIEGLLGKGLYLLAGASKIGKSWLVLWLAHCVSLGLPVWELKTRQCGVLYLGCEHHRSQRRVSTAAQGRDGNSLEDQVAALEKYGCQEIVKEAFTGKTMERPKFLRLLEVLQEGDTLVVCKLDRFARTAIEGVQTVRELFERGVRVHILNMGLIENTLTGNLILTVMLAFAEYERGMIVERTQTGKAVARQDPSFKDGRPKKFTAEQIQLALDLLEQGKTYRQITAMTGISKSTLIKAKYITENSGA